jgi:hypothetical protein
LNPIPSKPVSIVDNLTKMAAVDIPNTPKTTMAPILRDEGFTDVILDKLYS